MPKEKARQDKGDVYRSKLATPYSKEFQKKRNPILFLPPMPSMAHNQ
jgi:hypothetical protein